MSETPSQKPYSHLCIILHTLSAPDDRFACFISIKRYPKEQSSHLLDIRDRRLAEQVDSLYGMKAVCDLQETLHGVDLETTVYRRNCYLNFIAKLDGLKRSKSATRTSDQPSETRKYSLRLSDQPSETRKYSLRKSKTTQTAACSLFPKECIFCDKFKLKMHGKTKRTIKLPPWKNKEPAWKCIEPMGKALRKSSLLRKVESEDLFVKEAGYHETCRKNFNLEYFHHIREMEKEDTDQGTKPVAHSTTYSVMKDYVKEQSVDGNQVLYTV